MTHYLQQSNSKNYSLLKETAEAKKQWNISEVLEGKKKVQLNAKLYIQKTIPLRMKAKQVFSPHKTT
jgi:hypothetical protein